MSDEEFLLDEIEKGIIAHGGDLGGWTKREDDTLQLFDGRVTLRALIHDSNPSNKLEMVHAHVLTTLHDYDDEVLDACLMGMGANAEEALSEAAIIWITGVSGPIKSFIDNKPVCMTCQAGVVDGDPSQGYVPGNYGFPNHRAFVGPSFARGISNDKVGNQLDDSKPWFQFAAESAAPRRVHLAKSTVLAKGKEGWSRSLEVDGHDVSYHEPVWSVGVRCPDYGYLTRFAVFEFPPNSNAMKRRKELERTIKYFAKHYSDYESIDQLLDTMEKKGFDPELVHEVEAYSTIAFGRALFEHLGVQYSPKVIRARRNGKVELDVPLMSIPAYTRAKALAAQFRQTMPEKEFQALCLYNAESQAIMNAMDDVGEDLDLSGLTMYPCVVPDRGVSNETMDKALDILNNMIEGKRKQKNAKPWWKFW
ncbi:MAG: hypothetical protein R3B84_23175 [Zavarzinella sp.]